MAGVEMLAEMLARGSVKAGPVGGCAVCPARGLCAPCRPLTVKGESGSGKVLGFGSIEELFQTPELRKGIFYPSSVIQVSGEPPKRAIETSEKICSECKKDPCICR